MDIVKEEYLEDWQGSKKRTKIRIKKGNETYDDKFIYEIIHLECSPAFIANVINPRVEQGNRMREKLAKEEKEHKGFRKWKKEKFNK